MLSVKQRKRKMVLTGGIGCLVGAMFLHELNLGRVEAQGFVEVALVI